VRGDFALLRAAGLFEFISLLVLLANLATVHEPAVASGVGPLHGCVYILVVIGVFRERRASAGTRFLAFVPGVGGLLALRRLASDR
jgi:hypothetical protein